MNMRFRVSDNIHLFVSHPTLPIFIREFGEGARRAAKDQGITVIIDNFRASNTILSIMEYTDHIKPVVTVKEALELDGYITVGEDGKDYLPFDFDNSPVTIQNNPEKFRGKKIVVRTTNGTRGLLAAIGSEQIIIGSFRNITAVVEHCIRMLREGLTINFVPMGSKKVSRIEDKNGAKMMYFMMLEKLGEDVNSDENPWLRDWLGEIKKERSFDGKHRKDRIYSVEIDKTDKIPLFNPETGLIELIN